MIEHKEEALKAAALARPDLDPTTFIAAQDQWGWRVTYRGPTGKGFLTPDDLANALRKAQERIDDAGEAQGGAHGPPMSAPGGTPTPKESGGRGRSSAQRHVPPKSHLRKMRTRLDRIEANPLHNYLRPDDGGVRRLPDKVTRRIYMEAHDLLLRDVRRLLDGLIDGDRS